MRMPAVYTAMKCYHCGENEADLRFLVNYMGHVGEIHLCSACVEKFKAYTGAMLQGMAENGMANLQAWMGNMPTGNIPRGNVPLGAPVQQVEVRKLGEDPFPLDAGQDMRRRRRISEMRAALERAVNLEDYETAASLRDRIRQYEQGVTV